MYIVDDHLLALIARFMGENQDLAVSDTEFLLRQVGAIQNYIEQFPETEREQRTMEWIAGYAREYRRQWQKSAIAQTLGKMRCRDCPLTGTHKSPHCEIHSMWLNLLRHYIDDDISSEAYVESTLALLGRYKDQLKIGRVREHLQLAH